MPWHRRESWDDETLQAYTSWLHLRREHTALRLGGLRWVSVGEDSMTFLREHADQRLLIHVARAEHEPVRLPTVALGLAGDEVPGELMGSPARYVGPGLLELPAHGPAAHVYLLP